jgi:hypothetical protein
MLTDLKSPRRDAQGRDVFEVWADMVLANPAAEYARVARDILPAEVADTAGLSPGDVLSVEPLPQPAVLEWGIRHKWPLWGPLDDLFGLRTTYLVQLVKQARPRATCFSSPCTNSAMLQSRS